MLVFLVNFGGHLYITEKYHQLPLRVGAVARGSVACTQAPSLRRYLLSRSYRPAPTDEAAMSALDAGVPAVRNCADSVTCRGLDASVVTCRFVGRYLGARRRLDINVSIVF